MGFSAPALTAGLRYTQDKKSFTPNEFVVNSKGGPFPNGLPVLPSTPVKRTFSKATPLAATPTFDPETVTSYEVGFKTSTWEDKLHFNAAAYLTNYDDIQVSVFQAIAPITANGGTGGIRGLEFKTQISPGTGWYFEGNAGLTDAYYTSILPSATDINLNSKFAFVSKRQYRQPGCLWPGLIIAARKVSNNTLPGIAIASQTDR